jgi:hypothetical protein
MDFFFLNNELFILAIFINIMIEIFKPLVPKFSKDNKLYVIKITIIRLFVILISMFSCFLLNYYNIREYTIFDGLVTAILSFGFYEIGFKQLKNGLYNFFRRKFGVAEIDTSKKNNQSSDDVKM